MKLYIEKLMIIFNREFTGYFRTPLASIFLLVFLALSAGMTFFMGQFFQRGQADLNSFFVWHPWLFLILMPAIGMRLWAEERKSGTIELLMTLPVTNSQLVLGKFLASWFFTLLAIIMTLPIWIMAGCFLSLTSCLSMLTKNQVIAFIVSTISCFIMVMAGFGLVLASVRSWAPLWFTEVIQSFSFLSHFKRIQYGVLDLTTFIFFISMIMICISINIFLVQLKKAD